MSILESFRYDGRVVVVTGASSGLGVAFAQAFAEAGADLVLAGRRADKLAETAELVEAVGQRSLCVATDVSSPRDCKAMIAAAVETYGRVDVLINNAGIGTAVPALHESPEQFTSVMEVNLYGTYWAAQAAASVMRPGSAVINIASVLGITTAALPQAAYSASKSAVMGLTRDLAQQWGTRNGIRVNAIAPGFFDSEMTAQYKPGYLDSLKPRLLLGRIGDPRELAGTALWLASPAAGYVTGQTITVDGGMSIA
ncbi:SDR family NAD(P)-dependent oxidoreductase [Rhodococcus baikonurensis]|uniref:SDR family NAD(P)-dependent oxidoreductase n=1 Tax=Rhodococcus erythropolis group TaxID=2840174 RepID=UPI000BB3360A|nr:glucose 1-dehydrogenase [Rhodococcus erythropolis]PBI84949.1 2-dehydro-3-deoxy-D-gluconate 5-dehydrogenase [Rhodococcus erythropolis]